MRDRKFKIQSIVKRVARSLGVEIRYAFQNPALTDPLVYARWLGPEEVTCVFDVGANSGQSARQFATAFPVSTIHSFEPFAGGFALLSELADASQGRIRAYPIACSDIDGHVDVVPPRDPTSGLNRLQPADTSEALRIPVTRIDTICFQQAIERIDLLKTDTEGHDGKVLRGAGRMLEAGRVRCIMTEVGFEGDTHHTQFSDVFSVLEGFGYRLAGIYEISYHPDLSCNYANALFVHPHARRRDELRSAR